MSVKTVYTRHNIFTNTTDEVRDADEVYLKSEADAVIAELKQKLAEDREFGLNRAKSADREIGKLCAELCEIKAETRRLKRALWLARAYRGYDNSILLPSKFMRKVWDYVERKCRAKAEEYR